MPGTKALTGKHLDDALKLLNTTGALLEDCGIRYSLDAGTLLGVMRENRLLPWDTDIDLAISASDLPKIPLFLKKIRKAGYIIRYRKTIRDIFFFKKGSPRLLKIYTKRWLFFKDERMLDIFIKHKREGCYYWTVGSKTPMLQSCPKEALDELIPHVFNQQRHWIPKAWDEYLQSHYGDWRTVKRQWNWRKDDLCNKKHKEKEQK